MPNWQDLLAVAQRDFPFVLPEVMLAFFGLATLLTDFLLEGERKSWTALTAILGLVFSGASVWLLRSVANGSPTAFNGALIIDPFFVLFALVCLIATAAVVIFSIQYLEIEGEHKGEYYALIVFSCLGMLFLVCGNDLIVLFLAFEIMALSSYVLAGFLRASRRSNEGAVKFVLLGAFSSAVLAYGFSLLYGIAGSTNLRDIAAKVAERGAGNSIVILALLITAAGVLSRIAAVPFHQWVPDVYEGAPTTVSAHLSVTWTLASFALLFRLFISVFWPIRADWIALIEVAAVLSLVVGSLAALTQSKLKRLLAYSSLVHIGYVLLGLVAAVNPDGSLNHSGLMAAIFYLLVYAAFNSGAFAVVILLRRKGAIGDDLEDLNGLVQRSPGAAAAMLIFVLSLLGVPPTAGFISKVMIFSALLGTGHIKLAGLGILCIMPAIYYYCRILVNMWMKDSADAVRLAMTPAQGLTLAAIALFTVAVGIVPEPLLRLVTRSLIGPMAR